MRRGATGQERGINFSDTRAFTAFILPGIFLQCSVDKPSLNTYPPGAQCGVRSSDSAPSQSARQDWGSSVTTAKREERHEVSGVLGDAQPRSLSGAGQSAKTLAIIFLNN